MKPVMASLENEHGDDISFVFAEASQPVGLTIMKAFNLNRHPVVLLIDKKGHLVSSIPGIIPREQLEKDLQDLKARS